MPSTPLPITHLQDQLSALLGCPADARDERFGAMLRRDPRESTAYWLQLAVAVGIATLGLAVGSVAVIIGAMLIAPLMGPIVGLGMGLATGSPFLVLRSAGRVTVSVGFALAASAILTLLLPFHEVNAELAARATPTALDLLTAAFCALAGLFAVLRPGSDTASTAAGTSIGISLVPPLCASGYGIGTVNAGLASGALLLFVTNLAAIVVVATLGFVAVGFGRVAVSEVEAVELAQSADAPIARRLALRLAAIFAARGGAWGRLLMPLVLLGVVYIPLRHALTEVSWEVRVKAGVAHSIERLPARVLQSRVRIERHTLDVAVVIVGTQAIAIQLRSELDAQIREVAGIAPALDVYAVADAEAVSGLATQLEHPPALSALPPPRPASLFEDLAELRERTQVQWPATHAGPLIRTTVHVDGDRIVVDAAHLGPPLGPASEVLSQLLTKAYAHQVVVNDLAFPSDPASFSGAVGEGLPALLVQSQAFSDLSLCVRRGPVKGKQLPRAGASALTPALLAAHPRMVEVVSSDEPAYWFSANGCAPSLPSAATAE